MRRQKKFSFVEVNDGSCWRNMQTVVKTSELPIEVTTGCSVVVRGTPVECKGVIEMQSKTVEAVGECSASDFPLQKKCLSPEFLRGVM